MQVFFIGSFGSIYNRIFPLLESKIGEKILIISLNENIYNFFKCYTKYPTILVQTNPNLVTKKGWYKIIINTIKSKMEYRKLFKNMKDCDIHFTSTSGVIIAFSYIQKLAKNNKVFFHSIIKDKLNMEIKPLIVENWKTKIICKVIKILLGIDVKVKKDCGIYNLCVYKEFFTHNKITVIYQDFNPPAYKNYIEDLSILKDKKVLVLWSDLVGEGRIDEKTFTEQSNQLIQLLKEYYPNKYIIKAHPNMSMLYGVMVNQPQLESYVPSQFFMYHPWKIVIADCSAALVFPEEQNLDHTKLIEMIDILRFKDEKVKSELKQFLISWNPKLLFPQSFKELEMMLK
jgi:hypothetical protein